jgi:hypothetical protein
MWPRSDTEQSLQILTNTIKEDLFYKVFYFVANHKNFRKNHLHSYYKNSAFPISITNITEVYPCIIAIVSPEFKCVTCFLVAPVFKLR